MAEHAKFTTKSGLPVYLGPIGTAGGGAVAYTGRVAWVHGRVAGGAVEHRVTHRAGVA